MATEEERKPEFVETPQEAESEADSTAEAMSCASQEKSETQRQCEAKQKKMRLSGGTPSSADLTPMDLEAVDPRAVDPRAVDLKANLFEIAPAAVYRKTGEVPMFGEKPARGGDEPASAEKPARHGDTVSAAKPEKPGSDAAPKATVTLEPVGEYSGEDIKRDVAPATTTNNQGKNLNDIARQHLGGNTSEYEIQKHVREIARINQIDDPTKPLEEAPLKLPGHTKDGGFVTEDRTGNKRTVWDDGTVRIENKDGTGSLRKWEGEGVGYAEHHSGSKPEANYELRRNADGKYEVAEAGTENFREPTRDDADIRVERAKLKDLADSRISEAKDRLAFDEDMAQFEQRSKQLEEMYVKEGMSQEDAAKKAEKEIAKTYQEVSRIFEHEGDKPVVESQREFLAMQIMHHSADPTSVSQGQHPTGALAALESRLYKRSPSDIANMMAEVATKGEYTTKAKPPLTVKIPAESMCPQGDEATEHPPAGHARSYASQVAQVTLANIALERDNVANGTPGKWLYVQMEESPAGKQPANHGGRVADFSDPNHPKYRMDGEDIDTAPGVPDRQLLAVSNDVTGASEGPILIENSNATAPGKDFVAAASKKDLASTLEDAKNYGKLPLLMHVHTAKEPFWTDSNAGAAGGSGGHHLISITDYDPDTGKVLVGNHWGESADRFGKNGIPVGELFHCTTSPRQDLEVEVEANRQSGNINTGKELELLEMQKKAGDIGDMYEDKLVQIVVAWQEKQDNGSVSAEAEKEQEQTVAKLREIIDAMPPAEKQSVLKRLDTELAAAEKKARPSK